MPEINNSEQSGTGVFQAFGQGYKDSKAVTTEIQGGVIKATAMVGRLLRVLPLLIRLLLLGFTGWMLLLTHQRIGLLMSLLLLGLSLPLFTYMNGHAGSLEGGLFLTGWAMLMIGAGFVHLLSGLCRLYWPEQMGTHVHRWSTGDMHPWLRSTAVILDWIPHAPTSELLKGHLFEPVLMMVLVFVFQSVDSLLFARGSGNSGTDLFMIPLMAGLSMLALAWMEFTSVCYQRQLMGDQLMEAQAKSELMQSAQSQSGPQSENRPAEGMIRTGPLSTHRIFVSSSRTFHTSTNKENKHVSSPPVLGS